MKRILMTGHLGLIGRHLKPLLESKGYEVVGFDLADGSGDIRREDQVKKALVGISGVVHAAAVSRVVSAQNNPTECWETNAISSVKLFRYAIEQKEKPWVLVLSSREVYGDVDVLPVDDRTIPRPVNVYGRSKYYMESKAFEARFFGLNTGIVRLSNVYGSVNDHPDRVIPAFCANAVKGYDLRVEGKDNLFDFTHILDTVEGLSLFIEQLDNGVKYIPALHLLTGIGTTLGEAADIAIKVAGTHSKIIHASPRTYDVSRFVGSPRQAKESLGWVSRIKPEEGIRRLIEDFKTKLGK